MPPFSTGWGGATVARRCFRAGRIVHWLAARQRLFSSLPAGSGGLQLGPWGALAGKGAAKLLELTMKEVRGNGEIFLDVPQGNRSAGRLLQAHGFAQSGATLLMYRGRVPEYRPEFVYSLASMGSYG